MQEYRKVSAMLLLPDFSFSKGKGLSYISFVVAKTNLMYVSPLFLVFEENESVSSDFN